MTTTDTFRLNKRGRRMTDIPRLFQSAEEGGRSVSTDRDRLIDTDSDVWEARRPLLAGVGDDGSVQRDPLVRIARALELSAVTSVVKSIGMSDLRDRAWRRMQALVEEIDEDATGPQDVAARLDEEGRA